MASATQEVSLCLPKEWKLGLAGNIATIGQPTSKDSGSMLEKGTSSPVTVIEFSGLKGTSLVAVDQSNTQQGLGLSISHLKGKTGVILSSKMLRKAKVKYQQMTKMRNKMIVVTVKTISTPQSVGTPQNVGDWPKVPSG